MNGEIPVGGIISWAKSIAGTPQVLPYGWALADGSTLSDPQSVFNGLALPNLTSKFLRGASSSGGTGGSDTHTHDDINSGGPDGDNVANVAAGVDFVVSNNNHFHFDFDTPAGSSLPSYYEVVFIIRIK